jgi:hypothetical protein
LSTAGAKYVCLDIKNFYLGTPLNRYEYMRIPITLFPDHMIEQYQLHAKAKNGHISVEIRKAIYGLPQVGILANKLLKVRLAPAGYYKVSHTPGLWKDITRPISFTLAVDDFGVKYEGKAHADHLIRTLNKNYKISEDWTGGLYCGITLLWDYPSANSRFFDAGLHPKTTTKTSAQKANSTPTLPLSISPTKIRQERPRPHLQG